MKIFSRRFYPPVVLSMYLLLSVPVSVSAQTFQVDTILYNGNSSKFINLVFMSEGFMTSQLTSFITNTQSLTNYFFNITPFKEYKNYFNVFAIRVNSVESGADHPGTASDEGSSGGQPVATVSTYFNSTFDYGSIHRLLVCTNSSAINSVVTANFPLYDQKVLLVNSTYYGGSGGSNATSSLHTSAFEILVHEIGHSFAALADEYYAGDIYFGEKPNMTQQTNPLLVKWKNWIGYNGVGIHQYCCGGNSALWYKPHTNCKMQYLGPPFCAVCSETIVERVHTLFGTPVNASLPVASSVSFCSQPLSFKLTNIKPIPNTLKVRWKLNGTYILNNVDSITINGVQLLSGSNTLIAEVLDTNALTRSDTHPTTHLYNRTWTITKNLPAISASGSTAICQGNSVTLNASGATSYLWNTGATTASISASSAGSYSVTGTVAGCSNVSNSLSVTVNPLPVAIASNSSPVCTGGTLSLSSGGGINYSWTGPQSFTSNQQNPVINNINIADTGNYTVIVTDANGCSKNTITRATATFCTINLQLRTIIEGYYLFGDSMQAAIDPVNHPTISDSITVQLADSASLQIVASNYNAIDINGYGSFNFTGLQPMHRYYVVIKTRNGLETWSKNTFLFETAVSTFHLTP
jgi:IgA Peptidase M64